MRKFPFLWLLLTGMASAAEVIPPAPTRYFNDYAHVVSPATAERLDSTLENFEKSSSSQILVAIYPKLQSDSSVEDYTVRVGRAWRVGQKSKNNGAILFIFVQDRKMRIEVGYGLEGALPDVIAKRIIEEEIKPRFQRGDYDGGVTAGVNAILQATRGEYKGAGRTVGGKSGHSWPVWIVFGVVVLVILIARVSRAASRGTVYGRSGRGTYWGGWGGGFSGGGGWSGGGGGASGGGFSGGGGSFGGGGASGSW